jgi:mitogen-activated protein kinase kinase 9
MALTVRERRLPNLHMSLDLPSCGFREYPDTSVASTSAPPGGEFRLSEFERLTVLGRGNGGMVYMVSHRRTSALYALKVLHRGNPGAAAEADAPARRLLAARRAVPRRHASGLRQRRAPSRVRGRWLPRQRCEPARGVPVGGSRRGRGAGAVRAIAHLHARHVVHRDVKPTNLLVTAGGEVKIADFGIAKVLSRAGDHCATYEGAAAYMSPERFDTERHGDADPCAADVWGLAVTILELVMGRYPLLPPGQKPTWAALMHVRHLFRRAACPARRRDIAGVPGVRDCVPAEGLHRAGVRGHYTFIENLGSHFSGGWFPDWAYFRVNG